MRHLFTTALVVIGFVLNAEAGVDFYSNTVFKASLGDLQSWNPIDGNSSVSVGFENNGGGTILQMQDNSAGYDFLTFENSVSILKVLESTSGTASGVLQSNSATDYTFNSSSITVGSAEDGDEVQVFNGSTVADGYSNPNSNYIGWAVTSSSSLYAIGWARINYNPASPSPSSTDEFQILEWAYNLATSGSSITFGDSDDSNSSSGGGGTVPEPGSLAVFGLIGLGAIASRRRR